MDRICSRCKETKDISNFYVSKRKHLTVYSINCKPCTSIVGKEYYKNNKDKVDAKNKRNTLKNKERYRKVQDEWHLKNKDKRLEQKRARYKKNSQKEKDRSKRYFKNNPDYRFNYYKENKEHLDELTKQWKLDNPGKFTEYGANRRASQLEATLNVPGDDELMEAIYRESARRTKETGVPHEVDHIIPLQGKNVRGLHVSWNLQILTQTENRRKRNIVYEDLNIPRSQSASEEQDGEAC